MPDISLRRIALLGCGAMGTRIARAIDSGGINAVLTHVYDQAPERSKGLVDSLKTKPIIVENTHLLSSNNTNLVVEAASQDAVKDVALSVIQNKKDLLIMSVGALLDEAIFEVLADACREYGRSIYLPSGAIAGIDALRAVRGELESVTLTTTKNPRSLSGVPYIEQSGVDLGSLDGPAEVFAGTAADAVRHFPANINVAALIDVACAGGGSTKVRIVADPSIDRNIHEVRASGGFGSMIIRVENVPDPDNPRTSLLAALSAIERIRGLCSGGIMAG
ncbi:dinucleotide-utilizing enzyme [Cenarchaeum symbiosum A]|uniref:L-aspartate dehydrogenase n=1 Tax=Cenarchaeum symbiosum (strain A) TaxID=414004 RepID=A0RW74_CENSY|nr:dinucleotide-utilizing enzyme [Cenarchaeum symbiosum A]